MDSVALYVHFPFCLAKCRYCDFNSRPAGPGEIELYLEALHREFDLWSRGQPGRRAVSLYLGGGTPSLLEPSAVARLLESCARIFPFEGGAEITIEANPGTVTRERLAGYLAAGVNRLSLGVQTFDDRLLARIGRLHTGIQARDAVVAARRAGFANVGIDLIQALPGHDPAAWEEEICTAVDLAPEHLSVYPLSIEEGTPLSEELGAGHVSIPSEEDSVRMFEMTGDLLEGAGYEQYEIANYARSGFRSRHNMAYWVRRSYLGFGAGAHSFIREEGFGRRWHNPVNAGTYAAAMRGGTLPRENEVGLTERDAMAEFVYLGLRLREGIAPDRFFGEFGQSIYFVYGAEIAQLADAGLLVEEGGRLRLTPRGRLLANQVFVRFL